MRRLLPLITSAALLAAGCGSDGGSRTVSLVTYDSFPTEGTSLNDALAASKQDEKR